MTHSYPMMDEREIHLACAAVLGHVFRLTRCVLRGDKEEVVNQSTCLQPSQKRIWRGAVALKSRHGLYDGELRVSISVTRLLSLEIGWETSASFTARETSPLHWHAWR